MSGDEYLFDIVVQTMSGDAILNVQLAPTALVSDILEHLLENGHCRICTLLLGMRQLEPSEPLVSSPFSQGKANTLTVVFRTAEGLRDDGYNAEDLVRDPTPHVGPCWRPVPFRPQKTKLELRNRREEGKLKPDGYSLLELKETGFSLQELVRFGKLKDHFELGYTIREAKEAGYDVHRLLGAGCALAELKDVGFTLAQFKRAGVNLRELKKVFEKLDLDELKQLGYGVAEVKEIFPFNAMINAGYTLKEMKDAGYTALTMKILGGYNTEELSSIGFAQKELMSC